MVAVNSGSSLSKVSDYVRKNRLNMPVIADIDRSLERSAGLSQRISLQNIYQARILTPDGTTIRTDPRNLEAAMEKAADGAAWKIDPSGIPESVRPLWQSIEFGGYAPVAKQLAKMLKSRNRQDQSAAQKLHDYVTDQLESRLQIAEQNLESNPWTAWKQLSEIKVAFKGYKVPGSVQKNLNSLEATDTIKSERAALKQLGLARKAANGNAVARKRAVRILDKLIATYPDTETAKTATDLLESIDTGGSNRDGK